MNLANLGDDRLKKMGDTLSYIFEGEEFYASRLNEMGRRLAGGLKSIGIGRGDHVVVSMPGVEVKIFDLEDRELPAGEQGEIVIRGPNQCY